MWCKTTIVCGAESGRENQKKLPKVIFSGILVATQKLSLANFRSAPRKKSGARESLGLAREQWKTAFGKKPQVTRKGCAKGLGECS